MWIYYNNNIQQIDTKKYCILAMQNFSIQVSKYLIQFSELTDEKLD